jgi:hypothetical protein
MPLEAHQPRILFIASGSAPIALTVADLLESRFADHQVDLVVSEALVGKLTPEQRQRVVFVVGRDAARLRFLYRARLEPYWMISVLLAGQPGYFTMKLAAVLLGFGRVIVCYNENAQAFALDRHHRGTIVAHITRRLGARQGLVIQRGLLRAAYLLVGEPLGLCWMLAGIGLGRVHGMLRGRNVLIGPGAHPSTTNCK